MHINDLVPGRRYNIKGTSNNSGVFVKYDNRYADFNSLILRGNKEISSKTLCSYHIDRWTFHDTPETLAAIEIAGIISNYIPEDAAGIIESFLIGKKKPGSGPYRYSLN